MKAIRKILVKVLGLKGYLRLISMTYIRMISMGRMKAKYAELFFLQKVLKKGNTSVDIGANLAYYSYFMAKAIGPEGQLYAVEPIPLFADVWKRNMKKYKRHQIELFNCALGDEAKEDVKMSIPIVNGVVRHGLTRVAENSGLDESIMSFEVPMKVGDKLLENANAIDFIKCDVEGYEQYVIPSLDQTIDKFKPMFQIELGGKDNRQNVVDYLLKKGYKLFILKGELLNAIQKNDIFSVNQDFYFIHDEKLEERGHLIRK